MSATFTTIVDYFRKLQEAYQYQNKFKARAFGKSLKTLYEYMIQEGILDKEERDIIEDRNITDEDLEKIGFRTTSSSYRYIQEIRNTGTLQCFEELKKDPDYQFIRELCTRVYGIGYKKAQELVKTHQLHSFEELDNSLKESVRLGTKPVLTKAQQKGNKYRDVILERIPHAEIQEYDEYLSQRLSSLGTTKRSCPRYIITGSYRRDSPTSGDIDVLLTGSSKDKWSLSTIMKVLGDIICDVLIKGKKKVHLFVKLRPEMTPRRMDLMWTSEEEFIPAALYFTGPKNHNIEMRRLAQKKGYKLNEYGLYKVKEGTEETDDSLEYERVLVTNEEEIYSLLGMKWVKPCSR